MDLVVDANILFAAMIKKGYTSKQLFRDDIHLYAPEFLFAEFDKYRDILLMKASRNEDEFDELLRILERRIETIPHEEIGSFLEEAIRISPDEKDVPYIALAIRLHIPIWSNDKLLKKGQNRVSVYNTQEIGKL